MKDQPADVLNRFQKDIAKLLRWLADEFEAGRAKVELQIAQESEVYERPRSWYEPQLEPRRRIRQLGTTWTMNAHTLETPKIEVPE